MTDVKPLPPAPFDKEPFDCVRTGIYDDPDISVFANETRDFAMLCPVPEVDYTVYTPRRKALGLDAYRKQGQVAASRMEKLRSVLRPQASFLEVGASEGAFLKCLRHTFPDMVLASQDTDTATQESRANIVGTEDFSSLDELVASGRQFDYIGFFHVLEHIVDPGAFLNLLTKLLVPSGQLVIEVPSFTDPLVKLFGGVEPWNYGEFFFQKQHPYYYSPTSLKRLLEHYGYTPSKTIAHQRYGLENHLGWLVTGKPGGVKRFRDIFGEIEAVYKRALEHHNEADAVIVLAEKR